MGNGVSDQKTRFANVVLPHLDDAFTLARWLTGNRTDAEDVVQEACLRAYRAIDGYAGGNPRAWTLTVVRHTAYTWLGKNRPSHVVAVDDLDSLEPSSAAEPAMQSADPEAALIAKADGLRLASAIDALPLAFRETLVLRELHDLDYRAIAEITGVPLGTVMSRLARARHRLIALLGKEDEP